MKLPFLTKAEWRSRWLVFGTGQVLHRVRRLRTYRGWDEWPQGKEGVTVCGRTGKLSMPGIFSRMGLPRCQTCCRALNVPVGDGAPFNSGIDA